MTSKEALPWTPGLTCWNVPKISELCLRCQGMHVFLRIYLLMCDLSIYLLVNFDCPNGRGEKNTPPLNVNNWCPIKREKFYFGFSYVVWSDRNKGTTPPWIHKYSDGLLARLCACMPACLLACLSACMSICLFVCLPVCLSICLSACLPVCLSACLFVPVCLSICLAICLSVYLPVCVSACLS